MCDELTVKKPKSCPKCNSKKIATIAYGYPVFTEKGKQDYEQGKIVLGGCCIMKGQPGWHCNDCNNEW